MWKMVILYTGESQLGHEDSTWKGREFKVYISSSENVERSLNTINEMALQRKVFLEGTMS